MLTAPPADRREFRTVRLDCDLVVVGGGMAGVCCAITAARQGLKVTLIQDRPVLGGNASSEVRLWILGATSHMGNNNRWAREGGVIDEILVENTYRNSEGNPLIFDTVVLEKVHAESNITLLLNTAAFDVAKTGDRIKSVRAFCSQNGTMYEAHAPLFCDASGDGTLGFLAGAAFRMGAESREEFDEGFAPSKEYGELLGHSMYFYTKDTGRPVRFTPPAFALRDITKIPRYRQFSAAEHGCHLWWIEYGGRLDTVHESETIKWELWKVVYGVWDYIKNSGRFPEAETLTLEWVGTIPGKRESRRFEGDYILTQRDLVEQRRHDDAVSFGGWAIDLHPADGVFSEKPGCNQYHAKGVYQIPYRCLYSRNVANLFLAGRIISASHVAFGSTRVIATCAHSAQAVGMVAAMCRQHGELPRDLLADERMGELQRRLIAAGQYIPHVSAADPDDLARQARVTASSAYALDQLAPAGESVPLDVPRAMLIPVHAGRIPRVQLCLDVTKATELEVQLRVAGRLGNFTPDVTIATQRIEVSPHAVVVHARREQPVLAAAGSFAGNVSLDHGGNGNGNGNGHTTSVRAAREPQWVTVDFDARLERSQYAFVCIMPNPAVRVRLSDARVTGVLSLAHQVNAKVAESAVQTPPDDCGLDTFEFWLPQRRPRGANLAIGFDPPLQDFDAANVTRGPARPTTGANAWVAHPADEKPTLTLSWDAPRTVGRIELAFDTDFDHPMESALLGHPENVMPFCVRRYTIRDDKGDVVAAIEGNHQTRNTIRLDRPITTRQLTIEARHPSTLVPAAIFQVRCYAQ